MFFVKFNYNGKCFKFHNIDMLTLDELYLDLSYYDEDEYIVKHFFIDGVSHLFVSKKKDDSNL